MIIPASALSLAQQILLVLSPHSSTASSSSTLASLSSASSSGSLKSSWLDLPSPGTDEDIRRGALVSSCTFAVGPPGPPVEALCPAFNAHCTEFMREYYAHRPGPSSSSMELKSRRSAGNKSSKKDRMPKSHTTDGEEDDDPLNGVSFRTGCTGGSTAASDGTYLSGYTATCVVDGVDWVPFVFDEFLKRQFGEQGGKGGENERLRIYSSFVGCQVPARL